MSSPLISEDQEKGIQVWLILLTTLLLSLYIGTGKNIRRHIKSGRCHHNKLTTGLIVLIIYMDIR